MIKFEFLLGRQLVTARVPGEGARAEEYLKRLKITAHDLYLNTYRPNLCLDEIEIVIYPRGDSPRRLWRLEPRRFT